MKNYGELEQLLFDDLRIDEEIFWKLSNNDLEEISKSYHCTNVDMLYRYMRRNIHK